MITHLTTEVWQEPCCRKETQRCHCKFRSIRITECALCRQLFASRPYNKAASRSQYPSVRTSSVCPQKVFFRYQGQVDPGSVIHLRQTNFYEESTSSPVAVEWSIRSHPVHQGFYDDVLSLLQSALCPMWYLVQPRCTPFRVLSANSLFICLVNGRTTPCMRVHSL